MNGEKGIALIYDLGWGREALHNGAISAREAPLSDSIIISLLSNYVNLRKPP